MDPLHCVRFLPLLPLVSSLFPCFVPYSLSHPPPPSFRFQTPCACDVAHVASSPPPPSHPWGEETLHGNG